MKFNKPADNSPDGSSTSSRTMYRQSKRGRKKVVGYTTAIVAGMFILSACGATGLGIGAAEGQVAIEQVQQGQQQMDTARDLVGAVDGSGVGQVPRVTYTCPTDADAMNKLMQYNVGMSKLGDTEQVAAKALYRAAAICNDTDMMVFYTTWSQR